MLGRTRLILVFLFLVLGIVLHVKQGISSAWYLYVAAALLMATHIFFGNVWTAFGMLKKGKIKEAEKLLDTIKRPDLLAKGHRAYYHLTRGLIALQYKEYADAEQHLVTAYDTGLRNTSDKAITRLNLAHICFLQHRHADCKAHLADVKALQSSDLMIKDKIKELEAALAKV